MDERSDRTAAAALGDICIATAELREVVECMRDQRAWTVRGHMAHLVDRANQQLQVLLHNAETLTAHQEPTETFDCPECRGQGGHFVATGRGARRQQCVTCRGKGYLP